MLLGRDEEERSRWVETNHLHEGGLSTERNLTLPGGKAVQNYKRTARVARNHGEVVAFAVPRNKLRTRITTESDSGF